MSRYQMRYTKPILSAVAVAALAVLVAAPAHGFKRWDFGGRAGVNIAGLYGPRWLPGSS